MNIPEIKYNLHDSDVLTAKYNGNDKLELNIKLYEIYYPDSPEITLIISGIFNQTKLNKFYCDLVKDPDSDGFIWGRINAFHFDEKCVSKQSDLYVSLDVDHVDPIRIHCKKINFTSIENSS